MAKVLRSATTIIIIKWMITLIYQFSIIMYPQILIDHVYKWAAHENYVINELIGDIIINFKRSSNVEFQPILYMQMIIKANFGVKNWCIDLYYD